MEEAGALTCRVTVLILTGEGGGTSIHIDEHDTLAEQVASAASQVQDVVAEELAARASNCPTRHPLQAIMHRDSGWWACPADGARVTRTGDLQL